ncbi:hypothetical protein DTO195F2_6395 [Paecilomyces variotii]|nr:hypothetical protein DTO195F2_6395 [Paecilomyces variotii]KAJ9395586.1 hypothetical protein DTO282F9_7543 [Paecilomyces variotii]
MRSGKKVTYIRDYRKRNPSAQGLLGFQTPNQMKNASSAQNIERTNEIQARELLRKFPEFPCRVRFSLQRGPVKVRLHNFPTPL